MQPIHDTSHARGGGVVLEAEVARELLAVRIVTLFVFRQVQLDVRLEVARLTAEDLHEAMIEAYSFPLALTAHKGSRLPGSLGSRCCGSSARVRAPIASRRSAADRMSRRTRAQSPCAPV